MEHTAMILMSIVAAHAVQSEILRPFSYSVKCFHSVSSNRKVRSTATKNI